MAANPKLANLEVTPVASALGAEVRGIDLREVTDNEADVIRQLLLDHLVLFFPDQHLSIDEHVAFGRHFGHLEGHPNLKNPFTDHPELFELAASKGGVADEWHTDITFQESPAIMSVLNVRECPPIGGDTMWSSMYAAYDALSPPMKELCEGLTALHDALPHGRTDRMAIHPVVRVHPITRKKSLFVNEHFTRRIVEMSADESEMLLGYLTNWVKNPRFVVRYQWSKGTIGMWDNRCTQHAVVNDIEGERIIQRVTIMGDEVEAAHAARWEPFVTAARTSDTSRRDRQLRNFLKEQTAS